MRNIKLLFHRSWVVRSWVIAAVCLAFGWTTAGWTAAAGEPPEESVKPGVNEMWKGDDVDRLVGILDAEDREIYTERKNLAALVGPRPGAAVADIGAGSGFMAEEFARLVGTGGKVWAVDINAKMMERVAARMKDAGLGDRVRTVVSKEDSVELPAGSIDLAFVCDTYHHFEYPRSTLASIHDALAPNGQLVVVEFHRKKGESDDWVLEHVRGGQEVFTREIEEAGFELVNVHDVPFLARNYVLRFRKLAE